MSINFNPPTGEQCGRCWHNHTPGSGIICGCSCHSSNYTITNSTTVTSGITLNCDTDGSGYLVTNKTGASS